MKKALLDKIKLLLEQNKDTGKELNKTKLYHGSPIKINDIAFCSETYFTEDLEIAQQYGQYVYEIELDEWEMKAFQKDSLNEHYISNCIIPMWKFNIIE